MKKLQMKNRSFTFKDLPERCDEKIHLHIPLKFRRGILRKDERQSIDSAIENLKQIAKLIEREDWSEMDVLDFGCGVKFTQTFVQYGIGVKNYVGLDVSKKLIRYLSKKVDQPNFHFYDVPFKNEKYNPKGVQMIASANLPGAIKTYDIITLQSVFTHFNPADFRALLHILRRNAAKDARMFFTCFIDNTIEKEFIDFVPNRPMQRAYYKEQYIRDMLIDSRWKLLVINPPCAKMMHQIVCAPI